MVPQPPAIIGYLRCEIGISPEITDLIDEISQDRSHGASELARQAVGVLKTATERSQAESARAFLAEQEDIGQRLVSARPTMAPIYNLINPLLKAITIATEGQSLEATRQIAMATADEAVNNSLQAVAQTARYGSRLVADGDRIMTHSYSSTVVATLKEAFTKVEKGETAINGASDEGDSEDTEGLKGFEVIVTRSGPVSAGERTARELGGCGIPVTFIDDTAIGLYLPTVNKVVIGADRICADGMLVNGIGTYQRAVACEKNKVPLYVICETLKFDLRVKSDQVDPEEKDPSELIDPGSLPPGTTIKNPYFDITPLEMVTAVVTENGLLTARNLASVWQDIVAT
ncbi:MAG: hypothetical protein JSW16_01945 [Dehalococcoidales bacterium]|nr:MAG: hypothetical protein JSW16_01945 [Dehalococcoidales bacterium]